MLQSTVNHGMIDHCVRNIDNPKRISVSHRCFVKIHSKHAVQKPSETTRSLSDHFSKYMDDFIAELPARILEHKVSLHLHHDITEDDGIFVSLETNHNLSRLPDVLLEVIIALTGNGEVKRYTAEDTLARIVRQHFEPANIPDFRVEVFVHNRF